jgi:hypothetical protein
VLDQVNGRLVRLEPDGKAIDTISLTVQVRAGGSSVPQWDPGHRAPPPARSRAST